ncbi:hypothetical protein [Cytobacillus solani]|uniref:Uncharacterized protein n=1 Tax=Cytobacillus solani TaxID=1637975 RepID=A0A0Q3VII9_9BACI|nr:hypothetical protein [Cytobacillus solani]KQL20466.1 hypothetical protein AN957_18990 [Cytobacillus solani]
MAKIQRKYDFQNGTRTNAEQVDEEFNNIIDAHNSLDDEVKKKVDETGDFKGTWNGHSFQEADPLISSRVTEMENMVKEEEKITVTLKRGENTIEAPENAALVPVEILGDEVKNHALDFNHWTLHANVVKNSPDKVTLNAASAKEVSSIRVEIKRNQDYVYSMKHSGAIAILDSTMSDTAVVAYTDAQFIKFNSANNSIIHLAFKNKNDEPGTFTFEGPMLVEGTVEREFVQNYQPVRGPYIEIDNGSGLYFDEYLYKGDKLYQDDRGNWRKKQNKIECELTAETVKNPTINSSYIGGKAIKIPLSDFSKGIDIYDVEVIKFNNSYFTRTDSAANITNNRYYLDNDSLILFVSATDTGWQDDPAPPVSGQPTYNIIPNKHEILAFILGWKMAHADGTVPYVDANKATKGDKKWLRIIGTGESLTLPTASYHDWKPIKVIYKTVSEQDVSTKYEGALRLVKGTNKVTLGEGVVIREVTNPVHIEKLYRINDKGLQDSSLKNEVSQFLGVYKNNKKDNLWSYYEKTDVPNAFGDYIAQIDDSLYDPVAIYTATYKVLDRFRYSCYVKDTLVKGNVNFHMESDEQVVQIEELKRRVSQIELDIVDKLGKPYGIPMIGKDGYPRTPDGKTVGKLRYKRFYWEVYTTDNISLYPAHLEAPDKPNKYTKTIPLDGIVPKMIKVYFSKIATKPSTATVIESANVRRQDPTFGYTMGVEEWLTTGRVWIEDRSSSDATRKYYVQFNKDIDPKNPYNSSSAPPGHSHGSTYSNSGGIYLTKFYNLDPLFSAFLLEFTNTVNNTVNTPINLTAQVEVEVWGI